MPSETSVSPRPASSLRRRRLFVFVVLIGGMAGFAGWRGFQTHRQAGRLDEVRAELNRLRTPSETPLDPAVLVKSAEETLEQCVEAGGADVETAQLFLAVVRSIQARQTDPGLEEGDRWPSVSVGDLALASELLFHAGQWEAADGLLDQALARGESRGDVLRLAATIRYDLGREDEVLQYCAELKRLAPDDPRPWIVEGRIHEDRSHWPQALEAYREAVRLGPDVRAMRWKLVEMWIQVGQAKAAREALSQVPEDRGSEDTRRLLEARILELDGKSAESLAIVDDLLKKYPDHPESLLLRGRLLLGLGRLDDARQTFESLAQADPTMQEAYYNLGQIHARLGERDKAAVQFGIHRQLADKKLELYKLERQAGREPANTELRERIAALYEEIGLSEMATFWRRASGSGSGN